jgi:signal transduction histidine kinase
LAQVGDLVANVRAAGIEVTLDEDLAGVELSGAVELAAFRIVQEALTNVVRHSGARHAAVALRGGDGGLVVEVVDDGLGPRPGTDAAPAPVTGGFGLAGIAERVEAVGGRLDLRRRASGGFRVRAVLPAAEPVA